MNSEELENTSLKINANECEIRAFHDTSHLFICKVHIRKLYCTRFGLSQVSSWRPSSIAFSGPGPRGCFCIECYAGGEPMATPGGEPMATPGGEPMATPRVKLSIAPNH